MYWHWNTMTLRKVKKKAEMLAQQTAALCNIPPEELRRNTSQGTQQPEKVWLELHFNFLFTWTCYWARWGLMQQVCDQCFNIFQTHKILLHNFLQTACTKPCMITTTTYVQTNRCFSSIIICYIFLLKQTLKFLSLSHFNSLTKTKLWKKKEMF